MSIISNSLSVGLVLVGPGSPYLPTYLQAITDQLTSHAPWLAQSPTYPLRTVHGSYSRSASSLLAVACLCTTYECRERDPTILRIVIFCNIISWDLAAVDNTEDQRPICFLIRDFSYNPGLIIQETRTCISCKL